ncbi:COG1830: DhnA-type fructose-1,6-bisphosphate aldolase and related enzymes [Actinomycetales bacterium JB111]|nr:COG1830: DhnA-type fructose-1,6-bisphosphate aldolase and related enzymes [Actinomycetales bacterium JB111]
MSGVDIRLGRLFAKETGRSFTVAFDHGQALKLPNGTGNPVTLLERIAAGGPDAILLNKGMLAQASHVFAHRGAPAAILRADWTTIDPEMKAEAGEAYRPLIDPADALALGADALCVYLIGRPEADHMFADNVATISATIDRAHEVGLPVIVEATLWGLRNEDQKDPERLRQICRIAAEVGADAIKTEYVGDVEAQRTIIEEVGNIPVLTLGGAPGGDDEVAAAASDAISSGARGLIFGRNVWLAGDLSERLATLGGITHSVSAE